MKDGERKNKVKPNQMAGNWFLQTHREIEKSSELAGGLFSNLYESQPRTVPTN